jgi:hypothetical protein
MMLGNEMIDPHPLWHALQQHVIKSLPEYSIIFGLLFVAMVANMIRPELVQAWLMEEKSNWLKFKELAGLFYKWFYDSMQAFMAARHPPTPALTMTTTTSKEQTNSGGGVTTMIKEQGTESRAQGIEPPAKEEI